MRFGSVCSGIEAASVAWEPLGWTGAWFSEIGAFPNAVLAHRWPEVPNLGDMTKIYDKEIFKKEPIDILVGGTPCQSFSVGGFRKGLRDSRGALALAFCRIAKEKQPPWVVWENVPGVLSSGGGRDFAAFLGALEDIGYSLAYRVLDARYFGVPQRRRRVFVVGHRGDNSAEYVLFDGKGGSWNAPSRWEAPRVETIPLREPTRRCGGIEASSGDVSYCLLASGARRDNPTVETFLIHAGVGIRRLMPVEYERLQGFPDNYTRVPHGDKPAAECPDSPRYKALGNSIAVPVMRWIGERIIEIESLREQERVTPRLDPERLAKIMDDEELLFRCEDGFRDLREIIPYLREARNRFAQPGRRVPVPGNPTWTEWVKTNLHVTVRRVQQLLAGPRETISPGSKDKARELRVGDWRSLFKATERRTAQVFGRINDAKKLAGTICNFAQALADEYAPTGGKLDVSVSVKSRR